MTDKTKSAIVGSFKNALSTFCGVVLGDLIDPETFIFTAKWGKHFFRYVTILIIVNEARYWKTWADNPENKTSTVLAFFIAFFGSLIFQVIFSAANF